MEGISETLQVAKGISDYGIMIVICAVFLLLSSGLMVACFRWFRSSIDKLLGSLGELDVLNDRLGETNRIMRPIAEGLVPETQLRIRNLSGFAFDLSVEQVCRLIKKVREENHIADREATAAKIRKSLTVMHEDRNSRFDTFSYRGEKLSSYCNPDWVEQVAAVVEGELYNEAGANNGRTYTNVKLAYDNIKTDFYHRMNS